MLERRAGDGHAPRPVPDACRGVGVGDFAAGAGAELGEPVDHEPAFRHLLGQERRRVGKDVPRG